MAAMRGTPCSVKAPLTTGLRVLVRIMYRRQASETWASMSALVEKAVARYGMCWQAVAEPDVLHEVGRVRQAHLARPMVEDLQPARAGHEVDAVAADVGMRVAVAVVEPEGLGGAGDGSFDDIAREAHPMAGRVGRQAGLEEPPAHLRAADLHARLGQDAHRLVEDALDERGAEDVEGGTHRRTFWRLAPVRASAHVRSEWPACDLGHRLRLRHCPQAGMARSRQKETSHADHR